MNISFFGNAQFMGSPISLTPINMSGGFLDSQVQPLTPMVLHDEWNPVHVMGCKKCKRKKRKTPFSLPQGRIVYNQ